MGLINEKSLDEILKEARSKNCDNSLITRLIDNGVIARTIANIKSAGDRPSMILDCNKKPIKQWTK